MFFRRAPRRFRTPWQLIGAFAALSPLLGAAAAVAQSAAWPSRPIKIVVPLTPGGSNDVLGRLLAERLQAVLGQPVVVENRPGAGGNLGTEYVAKQPGDGYTLLISSNTHVINTNFFAKLPYHPFDDFESISIIAMIPFVMSVNAASPAKTVKDFIDLARAKPGALTYATAGIGTPHHLSAELLKSMTGIDIVHVPYKGAAGLVPALVANEVSMTIGAINSLLPHFRSGRLRPLAVVGAQRTQLLPDVPPMAEAANLPGYELDIWVGVLAPAKTPRAIVDRLNTEINKVMRDPQLIKDRLTPLGIEPVGTSPERYVEIMKADMVRYQKIVRDAGIKPE